MHGRAPVLAAKTRLLQSTWRLEVMHARACATLPLMVTAVIDTTMRPLHSSFTGILPGLPSALTLHMSRIVMLRHNCPPLYSTGDTITLHLYCTAIEPRKLLHKPATICSTLWLTTLHAEPTIRASIDSTSLPACMTWLGHGVRIFSAVGLVQAIVLAAVPSLMPHSLRAVPKCLGGSIPPAHQKRWTKVAAGTQEACMHDPLDPRSEQTPRHPTILPEKPPAQPLSGKDRTIPALQGAISLV